MSIRPKYSGRIMAGEKTVELRRRFPASAPKGTIAYIYSTSPERAMVGVADIAIVRNSKSKISGADTQTWHLSNVRILTAILTVWSKVLHKNL